MQKILIANRGEIAVRIVRACAEAGYASVAVYADQDLDAMHVRLADQAVALHGTTAAETYLDIAALLAAAAASGADAVHPGYGFLSESGAFARAVESAGLTWIGPTPESIDALGDKLTARAIARDAGAPLTTGTDRTLGSSEEAVAFARAHGVPVVVKAAFGGGGRGVKVAHSLDVVADAFDSAQREAVAAFGRGECFIERYLERARRVEVQVLGDGAGNVVVVGDRDCSLQRRSQKLIEEAPAPGLTDDQRARIHRAARDICATVDYRGAGTVEFLLARDGTISFLEVNTRLQVEHPITEAVTGVDLVREQLRIAEGHGPSCTETPEPHGHAIELRLTAEDPGRGFLPSPGRITSLQVPGGPGVRWDAGVEAGDAVEAAFDSLMAKLIVHAGDRDAALMRLRRALRELSVTGLATIVPVALAVLDERDFMTDTFAVHTQWIEETLMRRLDAQRRPERATTPSLRRVPIDIDGRRVELRVPEGLLSGLSTAAEETRAAARGDDDASLRSNVPGTLARWLRADGAAVEAGEPVAVVDAMKLETSVAAHRAGTLAHNALEGDAVALNAEIGRIEV